MKNHFEFELENISCVSCAQAIEDRLNGVPDLTSSLSFSTQRLYIDSKLDHALVKRIVEKTLNELEPRSSIKGTPIKKKTNFFWPRMTIGLMIALMALIWPEDRYIPLYVFGYLLVGVDVLLRAAKNISKGRVMDEFFLMSIATLGALVIFEWFEAIAVMLFYQLGEAAQRKALASSRKSIKALMAIKPEVAYVKKDNKIEPQLPEDVAIGEIIVVRPGERIPLDGIVIKGTSSLDMQAITGEAMPVFVKEDASVYAGSLNTEGYIEIKTTTLANESTLAKIETLTRNAEKSKAKTERFMTVFAKKYTPIVVFIAIGIAVIPPLWGENQAIWFHRSLIFLVISCPCALVISIPLGFFGGIGGAAKRGILVKGGNHLETLAKINVVVFDKTGTLTKGEFFVEKVDIYNDFNEDAIMRLAAHAEAHATHPIAKSIQKAYQGTIDQTIIHNVQEKTGLGVKALIDEHTIHLGSAQFFEDSGIVTKSMTPNSIALAIDGMHVATLSINDQVKPSAKATIEALHQRGIQTFMLTGDQKEIAEAIAKELGIQHLKHSLKPDQKVAVLEEIKQSTRGIVAFIGDGINDAPVIAHADVGLAMGGLGSPAAIEAADIVIMDDDLKHIITGIGIAKKTRRIVWQNIAFALGFKVAVMVLGVFGLATLLEAVIADVGVALLAVFNASRVLKS